MVFFVTGGSRGIGAAIVLAAIEAGHQVAFTYREQEESARKVQDRARELRPDCKCKAYRLDVSNAEEVERVGNQVLDDFDTVEVVVNNAATNRDNLAASMSDEEWHLVIETNLSGPFYVCRHFLTTMIGAHFGRIINISSVSATGSHGQINYAAAKAGLRGLTCSLAKEYGPKGITANNVVPGFIETEMTQKFMSEDNRIFWHKYCPARRVGLPEEVAAAVLFLATPAASFVNGAEVPVTGGLDYAP
jgi:NAD(P)-dependent dehydrogenase (short-subunit alcohol dehydrogenase family)